MTRSKANKRDRIPSSPGNQTDAEPKKSKIDVETMDMKSLITTVKHIEEIVTNNKESISNVKESISWIEDSVDDVSKTITSLKSENEHLKDYVGILEGRFEKMESKMAFMSEQMEDIKYRSMKMNSIFYNVKKPAIHDCEQKIVDVLVNDMKIPSQLIASEQNPNGTIKLDVAHPIGSSQSSNRPIVVKFVDRRSKLTMMKYVSNLKSSSVSVSDQLPDEMRERRSAMVPKMKEMKSQSQEPKTINLNRDVLYAGGTKIDMKFNSNPLTSTIASYVKIPEEDISHTVVYTDKITVQAHASSVTSVDGAASVLSKLNTINTIARAPHNSYAYRAPGENGNIIEGYNDDGLFGTGKAILKALCDENIKNAIVVLTKFSRGVPPKPHTHKLIAAINAIINTSGIKN